QDLCRFGQISCWCFRPEGESGKMPPKLPVGSGHDQNEALDSRVKVNASAAVRPTVRERFTRHARRLTWEFGGTSSLSVFVGTSTCKGCAHGFSRQRWDD